MVYEEGVEIEKVGEQKEKQTELKKFSEVYPSGTQFEAERIDFPEVVDKEIIIKDVAELSGDFGNFLVVLAELGGKDIQFPTGSGVIMPKLKKAKSEGNLPLLAKIVEKRSEKSKRRYYDIE